MKSLERTLRDHVTAGRKVLVAYVVGGLTEDWVDHVRAAAAAGADAIEVGVPFSDPLLDGPVIQAACDRALARGATLESVLATAAGADAGVPLLAMTYYNLFHYRGLARAAGALAGAGFAGSIVPDLPFEESDPWRRAGDPHDLANVLMVAPSTPAPRARVIATATEGFLYATARMSTTGEATGDGDVARTVTAARVSGAAPVLAGIGIGTGAQAAAAATVADGVIVGTAIVRRLLDGEGARGVEAVVGEMRGALS